MAATSTAAANTPTSPDTNEYERLKKAWQAAGDIGRVLGQDAAERLEKSSVFQIQANPIERTTVLCCLHIPDVCWDVSLGCVMHYLEQLTGLKLPAQVVSQSHVDASEQLCAAIDGLSISDPGDITSSAKAKERKEELDREEEQKENTDSATPKEFQFLQRLVNTEVAKIKEQYLKTTNAMETVEEVGLRITASENFIRMPPIGQAMVKNILGLIDINLRLRAEAKNQCALEDPIQRADLLGTIEKTKELLELLGRVIMLPEKKKEGEEEEEEEAPKDKMESGDIETPQAPTREERKSNDKYIKKQKKRVKRLKKIFDDLDALDIADPNVVMPLTQQLYSHFTTLRWPFLRQETGMTNPDGSPQIRMTYCNVGLYLAEQKLKKIWQRAVDLGKEVDLPMTKTMNDLFSSSVSTAPGAADSLTAETKETRVTYDLKSLADLKKYLMDVNLISMSIVPPQEHLIYALAFQWLSLDLIRKQYDAMCRQLGGETGVTNVALEAFKETRQTLNRSIWTIASVLIPKRIEVDKYIRAIASAIEKHKSSSTNGEDREVIDVAYNKRYVGSSLPHSPFLDYNVKGMRVESPVEVWRACFYYIPAEQLLPDGLSQLIYEGTDPRMVTGLCAILDTELLRELEGESKVASL